MTTSVPGAESTCRQHTIRFARQAIVKATTHYEDADMLAEISTGLGKAMPGLEAAKLPEDQRLENRGN